MHLSRILVALVVEVRGTTSGQHRQMMALGGLAAYLDLNATGVFAIDVHVIGRDEVTAFELPTTGVGTVTRKMTDLELAQP